MKTILITGSTDGIGKLAALKLAESGHALIVHGRSKDKVAQTIAEITNISSANSVKGYVSDLSNFQSIREMVNLIKKDFTNIDVLINNAGVYHSPSHFTQDHLDMRFAVNFLAPFILTHELMPLLEKSDAARVINLSSAAQAPVSLEALKGQQEISAQSAYAQSKLALTMWSFQLAIEHRKLNVIAVNPGSLLNTKMVKEAFGQHWATADKGAAILCDLALSNVYADSSGSYFDNDIGAFNRAHSDAYDPDKVALLMETTKTLLAT